MEPSSITSVIMFLNTGVIAIFMAGVHYRRMPHHQDITYRKRLEFLMTLNICTIGMINIANIPHFIALPAVVLTVYALRNMKKTMRAQETPNDSQSRKPPDNSEDRLP